MDKLYFLTFKQFTIAIATCNIVYQIVFDISETITNLNIVSLRSDVTIFYPPVFYIHTYIHSRLMPEGVAMAPQILPKYRFYQNDLAISNTADVTGGKPIA
jgi:hypothetical protein